MAYEIHLARLLAQAESGAGGGEVVTGGAEISAGDGTGTPVSLDPAGAPAADPAKAPAEGPGGFNWQQLMPLMLMLVVIYFFMFRGPQKKQKEHKQMMESLKRGDKIRTIGGIIAKVVEVNGDEVTIKVDESNNTKMTIVRNAIGVVLNDEAKETKS